MFTPQVLAAEGAELPRRALLVRGAPEPVEVLRRPRQQWPSPKVEVPAVASERATTTARDVKRGVYFAGMIFQRCGMMVKSSCSAA